MKTMALEIKGKPAHTQSLTDEPSGFDALVDAYMRWVLLAIEEVAANAVRWTHTWLRCDLAL